jgi:Domain of unknown function (DUF4920)
MKYLIPILIVLFAVTTGVYTQHDSEKVEAKELADGTLYGTDINADYKVLTVTDIFADLKGYEGKTVVVHGDMSEICRSGGCWTIITDGKNYIRAMTLHKFILPKEMDITNKKVLIEGEFATKEITEEQAKHFAEESGKDPNEIKGPQTMYRIKATGIKILK